MAVAPVASPSLPAPDIGLLCSRDQALRLIERFFRTYAAGSIEETLAVFAEPPAAIEYFDDLNGQPRQVNSRDELATYLRGRFQARDRMTLLAVDLPAMDPIDPGKANPTARFSREDAAGRYAGTAKFVCLRQRITSVVMSARPP